MWNVLGWVVDAVCACVEETKIERECQKKKWKKWRKGYPFEYAPNKRAQYV